MPLPQLAVLTRLAQPLRSVQPHRLQHPVPAVAAAVRHRQDRPVHQARDQIDDLLTFQPRARAHCLRRLQAETAGEHAQPPPQDPLLHAEQLMAPLHRRPQRLTAPRPSPPIGRQQAKPVIQPVEQITGGHRSQPHRGQLDRQRQPVETPADLTGRPAVLLRKREIRSHRHRPVNQQPQRLDLRERGDRQPLTGRGKLQRRQHDGRLPGNAQPLATGAQDPQPRTARHQRRHQLPARVQQMLAVIEHHQQPPLPQVSHQRFLDAVLRPVIHAHRASQRIRHKIGTIQLGQLSHPHAVREIAPQPMSRPQREPALADPARTRQRDHTRRRQQPPDLHQLASPPHEAAQLRRHIARPRPLLLAHDTPTDLRLPGACAPPSQPERAFWGDGPPALHPKDLRW